MRILEAKLRSKYYQVPLGIEQKGVAFPVEACAK
jgi:hypothetical protein